MKSRPVTPADRQATELAALVAAVKDRQRHIRQLTREIAHLRQEARERRRALRDAATTDPRLR